MTTGITDHDYRNLEQRVKQYQQVLQNTVLYREVWQTSLRQAIIDSLSQAIQRTGLQAKIEHRADIQNLQAVVCTLGVGSSGLSEPVGTDMRRDLIKQNGSLVYQQLFNGKILVLINYPFIEKYGQPQAPKTIAIYRPDEVKEPYLMRHLETFMSEVTNWEDYDDDAPEPNQRIGFKLNFEDPNAAAKK
jgi:hypothetical protein